MILIGMFDSPFVRRVAITMKMLAIPFEHRNWSVGKDFSSGSGDRRGLPGSGRLDRALRATPGISGVEAGFRGARPAELDRCHRRQA